MKKFPNGFLWGAATASYQVEGGIENNDWAAAARACLVPQAGIACDHYHRFEEDLDIAKELNLSSYRFSVEWSRIEPEEGKFDEVELEHYRAVMRACRARGIEPFVTLWHFTLPEWFADSGAFMRKDAATIFARYAQTVATALDDVHFFTTMNEPMVWVGVGHVEGRWPPFKKDPINFFFQADALVRAHKKAYTAIKRVRSDAAVGFSKHSIAFVGMGFVGRIVAALHRWFWDTRFTVGVSQHIDFLGINNYFENRFWDFSKREKKYSDLGWELSPSGIYHCLTYFARFNVPLYITEHGLADAKDQYRAWYIRESLSWVHRAIEEGVDVRGYAHWSLLDNFEWAEGFEPRFGLTAVDYNNNQVRTIRESARMYATICKENAL